MSLRERIKRFIHQHLPGLIYPYRWIRSQCIYIGWLPNQIHDLKCIRNHTYDFKAHDAQWWDAYSLGQYYSDDKPKTDWRGVIHMIDGKVCHGGPTDRLLGIITAYAECKKRDIPYHIYWRYPFRLEDYLAPNKVNWSIRDEDVSYNSEIAYPVDIPLGFGPQKKLINKIRFKTILEHPAPQVHLYTNEQMHSDEARQLFHELFRPSDMLKEAVNVHLAQLGERYWTYTFRFLGLLGDFVESDKTKLDDAEAEAFIQKNLDKMEEMLRDVPRGRRVLVTSDSSRFLTRVQKLDSRIYVVPGEVQNIDMVAKTNRNAWLKTFVDQQLIMHAEKVFLLRTGRMYSSGFPKFAAKMCGAEFKEVVF